MPHILFIGDVHGDGHDLLATRPEFGSTVLADPHPEQIRAAIGTADAIVLRKLALDGSLLDLATRLRIVSRHGVGCDNVDLDRLNKRGIPVTIVGDANSVSVAEHAMALLLATARRLRHCADLLGRHAGIADQAEFLAARDAVGTMELAGRTILIVGFGRIGRRVAKLAAAFDMHVIAADPFAPREAAAVPGLEHVDDFHTVLDRADCMVLCLPSTPGDAPLLGAAELARMKRGAVLINVARGNLIDEAALAAALNSGHLLGAGIDVWQQLPPGAGAPMLAAPGIVPTPHCAAHTSACLSRMATISIQNVFDWFDGRLDPALCFNADAIGLTR